MSKSDFLRSRPILAGGLVLLLTGAAWAQSGAPVITNPPAPQTIYIGDPVTFQVGAGGTAPLSYQWFRNGAPLSGATTSNLTLVTAAGDDQAQFSARVTNSLGAVTSAPVALTIDF